MKALPQRCPVAFLYLNWILYVGLAAFLLGKRDFLMLAVWLVAAPLLLYGYVRVFPRISRWMGYGGVADVEAVSPARAPKRVTMYTGIGCPFCPIVETRLRALQPVMQFELEVIDVTKHPSVGSSKRIGSVPTVEVEDRRRAGCMTSQELAILIQGEAAPVEPLEPMLAH